MLFLGVPALRNPYKQNRSRHIFPPRNPANRKTQPAHDR
jgi:hypothetical protein